ncbi:MAG TPA: hypothetical protein VHV77_17845 [Pirellulales bacterium]|jgi:hypothetical protein|nr:hypothetical protein [Pirellulales bacterium]
MVDDIASIAIEVVAAVLESGIDVAIDAVCSPAYANESEPMNETKPAPGALSDYIKGRASALAPIPYDSIDNDRER